VAGLAASNHFVMGRVLVAAGIAGDRVGDAFDRKCGGMWCCHNETLKQCNKWYNLIKGLKIMILQCDDQFWHLLLVFTNKIRSTF
jgi:hypothetical protein